MAMAIHFLDYIRKVPINYWIIIVIILIGCICIWWFFIRETFQTIPPSPTTSLALKPAVLPKFNYGYSTTLTEAFKESGYIYKPFNNFEINDNNTVDGKKYLICTTNTTIPIPSTSYYSNILNRTNIKYIFANGFDMVKVCNKLVYILMDNDGLDYKIRGRPFGSTCPALVKYFLSKSANTNDVDNNYGVLSCTIIGDGYDFYKTAKTLTATFYAGSNYNASVDPVTENDKYSNNMLAFKTNYLKLLPDNSSVTQVVKDLASSGGYDWSIWKFNTTDAITGNIGAGYSYYSRMIAKPQLKVYDLNDDFKKFMSLEFYNDLPALTYVKSKECYTISYGDVYLVINESADSQTTTITVTTETNDATIFTIYTATSPDNPNNNVYKYVALNETNEFIGGPYIIGFDYINSSNKSNVLKCYKYNMATGAPVLFTAEQIKTMNDTFKLHNLYMPWFEFHNISTSTLSTTGTYLRGSNTLPGGNIISSVYPACFKAVVDNDTKLLTGFCLENTVNNTCLTFNIKQAIYNPGAITTPVITDIYVSTDNKYYFINKYNNSAYVKLFAYPELKEVDINSYEKLTIDNPDVDNLYEIIIDNAGPINIIAKIYNYKTCKELMKLSTPIKLTPYIPNENVTTFTIDSDSPFIAEVSDAFTTVYLSLETESGYTTDVTQAIKFTLYRQSNTNALYAELTNNTGKFMYIDYGGNIQFVAEQSIYSKNTSNFYPDKYFYYNYNIWLNSLGKLLGIYDISKTHTVVGNKYNGKSIDNITFIKYEEPTTTMAPDPTTTKPIAGSNTVETSPTGSIPAETTANSAEPTTLLTANPEISLSNPITTQYEPILPEKTTTMPTTTTSQTLYTTVASTKHVPFMTSYNSAIQLIDL